MSWDMFFHALTSLILPFSAGTYCVPLFYTWVTPRNIYVIFLASPRQQCDSYPDPTPSPTSTTLSLLSPPPAWLGRNHPGRTAFGSPFHGRWLFQLFRSRTGGVFPLVGSFCFRPASLGLIRVRPTLFRDFGFWFFAPDRILLVAIPLKPIFFLFSLSSWLEHGREVIVLHCPSETYCSFLPGPCSCFFFFFLCRVYDPVIPPLKSQTFPCLGFLASTVFFFFSSHLPGQFALDRHVILLPVCLGRRPFHIRSSLPLRTRFFSIVLP